MAEAKRDGNYVPTLIGVSNADGTTPVNVYVDPTTHRLLVDLPGGGGSISGTIEANQIAFGASTDTIEGSNDFTFDGVAFVADITSFSVTTTGADITFITDEQISFNTGSTGSALFETANLTTVDRTYQLPDASGTIALTTDIPTNVVTASSTFGTDESILRSDGTSRGAQATGANATLSDAGALTLASNATANSFIPTGSTAGGNRMYLPASNTIGFSTNGTGRIQISTTALSPISDGGFDLGTTTLGWQNLHANTGFVLNIDNGNWVATHTSAILTVGTGDLRVTNAGTNSASVVTVGGTQTLTSKTLTSPTINTATLGGTTTFAEGGAIAYDSASSADGVYTGFVRAGTAGTTLAFGDLVYLAAADSRWELADADAASTSDRFLGMCVLAAASDGDPTVILLMGFIRADATFPSLTIGSPVYVGETAGDIQTTIPTGADNVIRRVGYAWTADELYFNPSMDSQVTVA